MQTPSAQGTAVGLKVALGLAAPPRPLTDVERTMVHAIRWNLSGVALCVVGLVLVLVVNPVVGGLVVFVGAALMLVGGRTASRAVKSGQIERKPDA